MIIEPRHFEYLSIQHGKVSDHRHDFEEWKKAYEASLAGIFDSIKPALPSKCDSVLDIGSGLGGIDILVAKHYSPFPEVWLLDGIDDPPVVEQSFKTFSNFDVAHDFLIKNGLKKVAPLGQPMMKFDLIHSYFAYGFHIHPGDYLDSIRIMRHKDTVLIFDVRKSKKEWLRDLVTAFGTPKVLFSAEKYVRLAFNAI